MPTLINHTAHVAQTNSSVVTDAVNTTGATFLAVVVFIYVGITSGAATISDSYSNTWTPLTAYGTGDWRVRMFYVANPAVGTGHTFTCAGTNIYPAICMQAWSGIVTTTPFDLENGAYADYVSTLAAGSITPSQNNELIICGTGFYSSTTISIDSGMTITDYLTGTPVSNGVGMAWKLQSTAVAVNPTWTYSYTSAELAKANIASFKAIATPPQGSVNGTVTALGVGRASSIAIGAATGAAVVVGLGPNIGAIAARASHSRRRH